MREEVITRDDNDTNHHEAHTLNASLLCVNLWFFLSNLVKDCISQSINQSETDVVFKTTSGVLYTCSGFQVTNSPVVNNLQRPGRAAM